MSTPADNKTTTRQAWIEWMMSDESADDRSIPYFSRSDLLRRGWTKGLIDRLLGKPDRRRENPHNASGAPMLCWREDRVLEIENAAAFKDHQSRRAAAKEPDDVDRPPS